MMTDFWSVMLLAYLAGSVNFAILFLKLAGKGDPREVFSGNPGVANVHRSAGWWWAGGILILDVIRAMLLAWLALRFLPLPLIPWIAFALVLGNRFPCFHAFRGGKGVAAYLGFALLLSPWISLFSALLWPALYRLVRLTFLASFVMILFLAAGVLNRCGQAPSSWAATGATVLLIVWNHRKNISALGKGSGK